MITGNPNYNHKLDFEKIYKILEVLEKLPGDSFLLEEFRGTGAEEKNEFAYYFLRMEEAGFLIASSNYDEGNNIYIEYPIITYKGHEYLANLRNDTIRKKIKEKVSKIGGSVSINLITKIATEIVMKSLL